MRDALATFHRLVVEGVVRHDGDAVLKAHVVAARASRDDRGWVVSKRKHAAPIDAVPALALAVWRAVVASESVPFVEVW
jgi:phage terminase large subunit-like protein